MSVLKNFVAGSCALALSVSQSFAGDEPEPLMKQSLIMEESAASSSNDFFVPLVVITVIALVFATSSGSSSSNGSSPSDIRLKTDILRTGTAENGLPLYQFRYVGQSETWQGVMAQDVLAQNPDAVSVGPYGFYRVDYGMLGLSMKRVD